MILIFKIYPTKIFYVKYKLLTSRFVKLGFIYYLNINILYSYNNKEVNKLNKKIFLFNIGPWFRVLICK